jgi:methanogenic corrinoid protein MtbC1
MLYWCSYCQQFMGEVPDYQDLAITHGMCADCEPKVPHFAESDFVHAEFLKGIQLKLLDAGRRDDLTAAGKIIADALRRKVRPVDILIGLVSPMLYQIGEEWKAGTLSVEGEHRFTAFCEKMFDLLAPLVPAPLKSDEIEALLMNAPGNTHTLAIRIVALWLTSRGLRAEIAGDLSAEALADLVSTMRPKMLLISMALAEQFGAVAAIAGRMAELPGSTRPKVFVGGYAVKLGLIPPIPGAELLASISDLPRPNLS